MLYLSLESTKVKWWKLKTILAYNEPSRNSSLIYSRENDDLNQTFEKQIIQFKRTWVGIIIAKYCQKLAYYT